MLVCSHRIVAAAAIVAVTRNVFVLCHLLCTLRFNFYYPRCPFASLFSFIEHHLHCIVKGDHRAQCGHSYIQQRSLTVEIVLISFFLSFKLKKIYVNLIDTRVEVVYILRLGFMSKKGSLHE